ncbi:MAG: DsbA family protein [Erysipelothrix sp.]
MTSLNIEFFHDVICSFCYPMSYRMRKIVAEIPEINIIHRSFALAPTSEDLARMFGSHENAKKQIMNHWEHANDNDTLHRFNIQGMKEKNFLFPTSIQPLRAAKAAYLAGGESQYWDVFDALQKALFTDNLDINNETVIKETVKKTRIDFDTWYSIYVSDKSLQEVKKDFEIGKSYGIQSVPSLVIDGKYLINGALDEEYLIKVLRSKLMDKKKVTSLETLNEDGEACNFENDTWKCD